MAAAVGPVVIPTLVAAASPAIESANNIVGMNKEAVPEPCRKKWGDPVAKPTLARRHSITAVVTEGECSHARIVARFFEGSPSSVLLLRFTLVHSHTYPWHTPYMY